MRIPSFTAEVVATSRISDRMRRLTIGGDGMTEFPSRDAADERVRLLIPRSGEGPPPLPRIDERGFHFPPGAERPITRTFTVRRFDPTAGELAIDIAEHDGLAATWAARAEPGDAAGISGPTGGYEPAGAAHHHLLVGDETALPAIATILERLPQGASADVFVEIRDPAAEIELPTSAEARVRWLVRNAADAPAGALLVRAVREFDWPRRRPSVWAAGESLAMRAIRRHLRDELGFPRDRYQVVGYWRDSLSEDEAVEAHLAAQDAARRAGASEAEIEDAGLY